MQVSSFHEDLTFDESRIKTSVILESSFSKEIRIVFTKGQIMKEHQTPFPIVVQVLSGDIDFGLKDKHYKMTSGDIISLEGNIPHTLTAAADSIVRLTLSKRDEVKRVGKVVEESNK